MDIVTFRSNNLAIEVEENETLHVRWFGKSMDRDPSRFILPILTEVLEKSTALKKEIELDFRSISYMNSSTITPIIRILERAKRGTNRVIVLYRGDLNWQKLSFTALEIFQTNDKRIDIRGE